MLLSAPDEVARTKAITFASRWTSASVRWEPMNPSAPVTRHVRPANRSPNSARSSSSSPSDHVAVSSPGIDGEYSFKRSRHDPKRADHRRLHGGGERLCGGARGDSLAQIWARRKDRRV